MPFPRLLPFLFVLALALPVSTSAAAPNRNAVVLVGCDNRQGSGTVIHGDKGYVLTNAHVVKNVTTGVHAATCVVGFLRDADAKIDVLYEAVPLVTYFDADRNLDFSILEIRKHLQGEVIQKPFPMAPSYEFPETGTPLWLLGYSGTDDALVEREGTITGFSDGAIQSTTKISPGDSGGAALNERGELMGMPSRMVTLTGRDGSETTHYELVDIRAIMQWLDTGTAGGHDAYFVHAEPLRYHQSAIFIESAELGCSVLARAPTVDTVYCIKPNQTRFVFPNAKTFFSWHPSFEKVITASPASLATFTLQKNVTLKPGTLVKSATASPVYVVTDIFGTMRHIPSEAKARELWGPNWAAQVQDIPDEFWTNYTIGAPL